MYTTRPGLILGFHGCDKLTADEVISGKSELKFSENTFDWLGHGIYFWEYSADRALDYAIEVNKRNKTEGNINEPAILGALIDLGYCLDLIEFKNLSILKKSFEYFNLACDSFGIELPQNRPIGNSKDLLIRNLDCAIIEFLHESMSIVGERPYDSVKGVFIEGNDLYPQAGFKEKNHVQICIRNPNCIKGFFNPRVTNDKFPDV
jgi:hypothetical protein